MEEGKDKPIEDMIITKSFSIKIKNKIKVERLARESNMKTSTYVHKLFEDLK